MNPAGALPAILLCALAAGCQRAPKCNGEPDQDELYRMQQSIQDGKEPCPEHLKPKIVLDSAGLRLNGELVARPDELGLTRHTRLRPLFDRLKQNRETWKMTHPGEDFLAEPTLEIAGDADVLVGASIVTTTAYAGYPFQRIRVGGIELDLPYAVPGPPNPDAPARIDLRIDRADDGSYRARYVQDSVVMVRMDEPLGFEDVPRWATRSCPVQAGPCASVIAVRTSGPFVSAVTLIKNVLDRFPPARRPRMVRFFEA